MAKLRTCKICGKQYEYCSHCPSKNLIQPWRTLYCSEECRDSFEVMGKYSVGKMPATEAREKLEGFGITPNKVRDVHKGVVADIFRAGKKVFEAPKMEETLAISTDDNKDKSFKKKRNFEKRQNNIVNEDLN